MYEGTGAGVTVYVVDTAVNTSHVDFRVSASSTATRITEVNPARINEDGRLVCPSIEYAHGTHVMGSAGGLLSGVAKGATLVSVRGLKCS